MSFSLRLCLPLLASLALVSCGDEKAGDTATAEKSAEGTSAKVENASNAAAPTSGPYKVKSGIVESTVDMMGEQHQTIYFDDYGTKQAIVTAVDVMGQKSETIAITADGWQISYDPAKKEGTKMKVAGTAPASAVPNVDAFTEEMKKEYKVKTIDSRTIAGKEAVGMSIEAMGMPMKVWTWEGIPLRTEIEMGGKQPVVTEVKSLQVDVPVPADKFVVPADVKLTELGK